MRFSAAALLMLACVAASAQELMCSNNQLVCAEYLYIDNGDDSSTTILRVSEGGREIFRIDAPHFGRQILLADDGEYLVSVPEWRESYTIAIYRRGTLREVKLQDIATESDLFSML